jgi:signal transduction histidine kinase
MNVHLILHDAGFLLDALLVVYLIILAFFKAKKGLSMVTLVLAYVAVIGFVVSHALGVSVSDPDLSRRILMFNLSDIFIPVFFCHCVFLFLDKEKEHGKAISISYTIGIGLAAFFILNPRLFLLDSVPKMYFPNYYVPGPFYWLMLVFFFSVAIYFIIVMWREYLVSDGIERNRIKYFLIALIFGYAIGSTDILLIYNIQFDPFWGFLFVPFYTIPFMYAALKYELMDIKLVAKGAFAYALTTATIGAILVFMNYLNAFIIQSSPDFPNWVSSILLALVGAGIVIALWRKLREGDLAKDEFISVVTHKFRTPLTSIKWSGENLIKGVPSGLKEDVRNIQISADRLVELTGLLVNLSGIEDRSYEYNLAKTDLGALLNACVADHMEQAESKGVSLAYEPLSAECDIPADSQRIRFVLQTLLDNALSYTPRGGKIRAGLSLLLDEDKVLITIVDTGIGISHESVKHLFVKFYRADNGRRTDTEGMGIGLYLSRKIIEKHGGKMWVESAGEGKGSKFYISLPMGKG